MFLSGSKQNPVGIWSLLPHSMSGFQHTIGSKCKNWLLNTFSLLWVLLPVLVVEVDGTWGQLLLSCLTSSSEEQQEGIFWMNNGVMEKQKGNLYVVHLEESLGGGNYTCHSKSGSLLNYTVVLIKEVKATRRKILLKNNQGRPMFVPQPQ